MTDDIQILKERVEKLERLNQQKTNLISISAHQLRTSLSALKWIFKMLLDGDLGELSGEQKNILQKSSQGNERLIQLVNDLLSFNHMEDIQDTYDIKIHNIVALIENVLFEFSGETQKKNVQIVFLKSEADLPKIPFDKEKVRVVLQNLIENAIKYSDEGDKIFITATIVPESKIITISVEDTGIGIPKIAQEKIFENFFRAQNAKEKDTLGSGLGLATSKTIIEHHNGRIWFESEEGKGSTFFFSLPLEKI